VPVSWHCILWCCHHSWTGPTVSLKHEAYHHCTTTAQGSLRVAAFVIVPSWLVYVSNQLTGAIVPHTLAHLLSERHMFAFCMWITRYMCLFMCLFTKYEQGLEVLGLLLAGSTGQQWQVEMGWLDRIYMASKGGLGWAGGSHSEFGLSSSCRWSPSWLLVGGAAPPVPH
jgi:hypothetical protein